MMRDRFSSFDLGLAFYSFGSDLKCPREHQRHRKSGNQHQDPQPYRPVWNFEERKNLCRDLDQQPRCHGVRDRCFVNIAPLELGEKVVDLHFEDARDSRAGTSFLCPATVGIASATSVRLIPSGVASNAHAITSAIGNPIAISTITRRTTQFGISRNGKIWVAICAINQPTTA